MIKFLTLPAVATVLALAAPAHAADIAAKPYMKAPPMPAVFSWTGFYIGGDVGYIWGRDNVHDVNSYNGAPDFSFGPSGVTGNGHIGYNWQSSIYVIGIEVEGGYMGLSGRGQFPAYVGIRLPTDSQASIKDGSYVAVTGRLGVVVASNWLIYAKGGYAATDVKTTFIDTDPTGTVLNGTTSSKRDGWTAGAGVEYAFLNNWTTRLEYAHYDFGSTTTSGVSASSGTTFQFDQSVRADSVRIGLNYKFGGPILGAY